MFQRPYPPLGTIHRSLNSDPKFLRDLPRREALAREARRFLGAPFKLHGIDPATGIDCAGVVLLSARTVGYPCVGLDKAFTTKENIIQLWSAMMNAVVRIPRADASAGDLLIIAFKPGAGHLSLVTKANDKARVVLHALGRPHNRVVEHRLYQPLWWRGNKAIRLIDLVFAAYRFRPVEGVLEI